MIDLANKLTDMNSGWWPFLFLRPSKEKTITTKLVAKMSVCFGSVYYPPIYALLVITGIFPRFELGDLVIFTIGTSIIFFVSYRLTFAYAWNLRAAQLAQENSINPD